MLPDIDVVLPLQTLAGEKQPLSATRTEALPKKTGRDRTSPKSLEKAFNDHE